MSFTLSTVLPIMKSRFILPGLHYDCAAVTEHTAHECDFVVCLAVSAIPLTCTT